MGNERFEEIMESYNYLIIGGGMTADAAVRGIRELDMTNTIGLISEEEYPPYDRPPLSKGLWFGKSLEKIWRKTEDEHISFHLNTRIGSIDPEAHTIFDENGKSFGYDKLLIATGGAPVRLNCSDEGVIYFRTLNDYYALRALYDKGDEFVVIGAGYIGTEIAAALAMNGKRVTMIFKDTSINCNKYPKKLSLFLNAYFTEKGVRLMPKQTVTNVFKKGEKYQIQTSGGDVVLADGVIAGLGITPNTELASKINLEMSNGIVVNDNLQTSHPDIFAAGDVANFFNPLLEKRLRTEHEDAANTMGKMAGKNMAGAGEKYTHLPYFYSDIFELGYEAIGEINSELQIVEDWHDLYRQGVLYYLHDNKVRGAMLWGIWNQIETIRTLIASHEKVTPQSLVGKL
ncbi:MAG: FAD/NAD(P)-binding oxidoreductase [Chlamydiales bacterium]